MRDLAKEMDTSHPTLSRRLRAGDPHLAIEIGHRYNASVIDGLLACGFIKNEDLDGYGKRQQLKDYSDLELAQEIVSRIQAGQEGSHPHLTSP